MKIRKGYVGNSSSSCFICDTNLSDIEIRTILNSLVDAWNTRCSILNKKTESNSTYEDMFNGPHPGSKDFDQYLQSYFGDMALNTKDKTINNSAERITQPTIRHRLIPTERMTISSLFDANAPRPSTEPINAATGKISYKYRGAPHMTYKNACHAL